MDNVTHSLIGIAAGEAVSAYTGKKRLPLWLASAAANNLPDLDVLLTSFVYKDKLGYFLHHRGHTHTFALAPLLAAFYLLLLLPLWRRNREWPWKEMALLALAGPFLHLFADFWNSYGVHPFWPFSSDWLYGDMVFIVEPWLWVLLLPAVFFASVSWLGRGISLLLLALILGLAAGHSFVAFGAAVALFAATAVQFLLFRKIDSRKRRISLALGATFLLLGFFSVTSLQLKSRLATGDAEVLVQPMPGNPFCWTGMEARLNAEEYRAAVSVLAPFPWLVAAEHCPSYLNEAVTTPLSGPETRGPGRRLLGVFRAPRAEYDELVQDCRAELFLRFARIPFWIRKESGWILGDLRFDRDASLGFGELDLSGRQTECAAYPFWKGRFHPERFR